MAVKSTNVTQNLPIKIDKQFAFPANVSGVSSNDDGSTVADDSDELIFDTTDGVDESIDVDGLGDIDVVDAGAGSKSPDDSNTTSSGGNVPNTPNKITVISQTMRFTSDGRSVVDVIVDVADTLGNADYEVKVTVP